jgi:hypothetical protein
VIGKVEQGLRRRLGRVCATRSLPDREAELLADLTLVSERIGWPSTKCAEFGALDSIDPYLPRAGSASLEASVRHR